MKNLTSFVLIAFFASTLFSQDEWAPVGTTWYYECWSVFTPPHLESIVVSGDTTIQGQNCRIIQDHSDHYTYEENGKVYFFNSIDSTFNLLYNFNIQPGEHWKIKLADHFLWPFDSLTIEVDNIIDRVVSGQSIKTQLVSFYDDQGGLMGKDSIFENIGSANDLLGLFNIYNPDSIISEGGPCNLHCFEIPGFDALNFYNQSCIISDIKEKQSDSSQILLSPNPASDQINISFLHHVPSGEGSLSIYDARGSLVKKLENLAFEKEINLPLWDLPPGLYFMKYNKNEEMMTLKQFVISR